MSARSELPRDVQRLLRLERTFAEVPRAARGRLAERLAVPLGASSGLGASALGKTALAGWKGVVLKGALLVAVGGGAAIVLRRERSGDDAATIVRAPVVVVTASGAAAPVAAPVHELVHEIVFEAPRSTPTAPMHVAPMQKAEDDREREEERRLLDEAQADVVRGEPAMALEATSRHATRFPRGTLAEERDAIRIRALARLGRKADAEALLTEMRARFPRSFLLEGAAADVEAIP